MDDIKKSGRSIVYINGDSAGFSTPMTQEEILTEISLAQDVVDCISWIRIRDLNDGVIYVRPDAINAIMPVVDDDE